MTKFNQTYSTDLKYTEWQQISEFFPTFQTGLLALGAFQNGDCYFKL